MATETIPQPFRLWARAVRDDAPTEGRTKFVVSTEAAARDGHIIDQSSWVLDGYQQNPVVLWGHNMQIPPVGRAVAVGVEQGELRAEVEWDTRTELGATVARQYAEGFLNAVSVRWREGEVVARATFPKDHRWYGERGYVFRNSDMIEFSAVTVPTDRHALAQRGLPMPRGVDDLGELLDWMRANVPIEAEMVRLVRESSALRTAMLGLVWGAAAHEVEHDEDNERADWWDDLSR